jgi:predicted RNA binding protein YcfA (HicA-like mRNA interferase family)
VPLRPLRAREVVRKLRRAGFSFARQEGAHARYQHPNGRATTVPIHPGEDISKDLLKLILKQAGISVKQWERL